MRAMNEQNSIQNPAEDPQIDSAQSNDASQRRIRSFVLRQGRLTKGQARALETGFPKFGISYVPELIDLSEKFNRTESKKVLEIGFGMGETTAKIAQTLPECDFLAAEVHTP